MQRWKTPLILAGLLAAALPLVLAQQQAAPKAKNVILFLADAGGIPTLNAASILGYNAPQQLYVQSWPYIGLSDTSTASEWVTDSAAGMTAIVTGQKTHNGVISQGADTQRNVKDGAPLKTLLESAEEKGLSTGVMTNVNIADATPAANYAHANDRGKFGEMFLQIFQPRFGDGVDVVFGSGRKEVYDDVKGLGQDLDVVAKQKGRPVYASLAEVPAGTKRPIVVTEGDIDIPAAARMAVKNLSQNPKGYFLMIEWDAHTDDPERGLNNIVNFDKLIRELAGTVDMRETLFLFTADHSFELRTHGGLKTDPVLKGYDEWKQTHKRNEVIELPVLRVGHSHTGEEVLAAAQGPGADQVHGYMPNTHLFEIMMNALGWQP